jgi:NDP-sugar pyrophosphorylase family protein
MQAVVLAAGQGSRLMPLTQRRPKAFLPLAGRTLLDHVLEAILTAGVDDLIVVLAPDSPPLPSMATRFRRCRTVVQPIPRGMADAVSCAAPLIEEDFLLSAADHITAPAHVGGLIRRLQEDLSLAAVLSLLPAHQEAGSESVETVLSRSGVVALRGDRVIRIVEKPAPSEVPGDTLSVPLYALRRDVLGLLPQVGFSVRGEREVQTLFQELLAAGCPVIGLLAPWRLTVNTPEQLLQANLDFLNRGEGVGVWADLPADVVIQDPVRIESDVQVGAGCCLGPELYLESGSRVGTGSVLEQAMVLRGGVIPAGICLRRRIIGP